MPIHAVNWLQPKQYQWLADCVLVLHASVVVFVLAGLLAVLLGNFVGWRWVNSRLFRVAHAGTIAVVIGQAWLGASCPLTVLEMWLRRQAAAPGYTASFMQHWVQQLLYYDAPPWVFLLAYSLFGLLVIATWCCFPPARRRAPARASLLERVAQ